MRVFFDSSSLSLSDGSATPTCHLEPTVPSPDSGAQRVSLRWWSDYAPGQLGYHFWAPHLHQAPCLGEHKSGETDGWGGRTGKDTWIPEAHRSDPGFFDARRCPVHQPLRLNCGLLELCAKTRKCSGGRRSATQERTRSDICFWFKRKSLGYQKTLSSGDAAEALELQRAGEEDLESRFYDYGLPGSFFSSSSPPELLSTLFWCLKR